jgi:ABC-type transport system involved in multi-copper enzyme maturation permease subunit
MHLSGLSPFGPIFGKELRTASRRKRNYLLRVLYLGSLLLFLLLAWAITRETYAPSSVSARQQQQEQLGWIFFMFFSMFSVIAMGLIGAVLTSTAINGERLHKTLPVLLITPLTAWQIVSGKLFSRLLGALTLIGLSLPVLAIVRLLGGVELQQMFGVIAMSAVVAMTSAALGLLLSIVIRRAYAVILMAYLIIGFVYLFVPIMLMMLWSPRSSGRGAIAWMQTISMYNPFWCTAFLGSGQMRIVAVSWVPCVLAHIGLTLVLLVISALLLRRIARQEGEGATPIAPADMLAMAAAPPIGAPGDVANEGAIPPAPVLRIGRTVSDNPVLWRELRRPLMDTRRQRISGALACLALLLVTYVAMYRNNAMSDSDSQIGYTIVFQTVLMLLACVISATAIAQEKEGDTWTVLLASPVSGAAIVWGKALGVLRRLMWPTIGIAAHFLLFVVAGVLSPTTFLMIMTVLVLFNVVWIATGVALSLWCRKVTVAVIVNLALPVLLYGVAPLLLVVFDEFMHIRGNLVELVQWWLPYYYVSEGIGRNNWTYSPRLPGSGGVQISQGDFLAVALGMGLLHLAVAVTILALTSRSFNAIVGRAPQNDVLPPDLTDRSGSPSWAASAG